MDLGLGLLFLVGIAIYVCWGTLPPELAPSFLPAEAAKPVAVSLMAMAVVGRELWRRKYRQVRCPRCGLKLNP
jgi:hypothetical protein